MKTIKHFALATLGAAFFSIALYSCSNDDASAQEVVTTKNINTKSLYAYTTKVKSIAKTGHELLTVINSSVSLKAGLNDASMESYIVGNKANLEIIHYIDGQPAGPSIVVIDGNITAFGPKYPNSGLCPKCDHDSDGNISDSTDCSSQGLNQCAYNTYQQWSTAHIVVASLDGEAQSVLGSCIARNCFGW